MASLNCCQFTGNIGKDPELTFTQSGMPIGKFSLAVQQYDSRTKSNTTMWLPIVCFDKLAERVEKYMMKGSKVAVVGRLSQNTWKNKDGQSVTSYSLVASEVIFMDNKSEADILRAKEAERYRQEEAGEVVPDSYAGEGIPVDSDMP